MNKKKLRRRVAVLEAELAEYRLPPPLTFDNLTVCFSQRTVTFGGRTITLEGEPDCITFPITNDARLLTLASRFRYQEIERSAPGSAPSSDEPASR